MRLNYKQCRERSSAKYHRYKEGLQACNKNAEKFVKDSADFVIIGAGTAGI